MESRQSNERVLSERGLSENGPEEEEVSPIG